MNLFKQPLLFALGAFALLSISNLAHGKVKPAALFTNQMVLQQQQKNQTIWGTATANKTVKIIPSWNNKTYVASSDANGRWRTTIETPRAGGPYSISFNDGEKTVLDEILIGEVWLCSGQSNMEMPMKGFMDQPLEEGAMMDIVGAANPQLRLFKVAYKAILTPQDETKGEWTKATPESVREFSATAYYFGRLLQRTLNVPVGLITTYWGGSTVEAWMSREMLADFPEVSIPQTGTNIQTPQRTPTLLYNGMIHPLIGFNLSGMIWYQGESNVEAPALYEKLFEKFVNGLRQEWNVGDFPFYYCQISPYYFYRVNSALLREAQMNAESRIKNSGMAVLTDAGLRNCIHPQKKQVAGERLALQALGQTYQIKGITYQSPTYKSMKVQNDTVVIDFDRAPMGLTSYQKPLKLFTVAGEDQKFYPATKVWFKRNQVFLLCESIKKPVAARYAFDNYVEGDLFGVDGLPVSSFRTDRFETVDTPQ